MRRSMVVFGLLVPAAALGLFWMLVPSDGDSLIARQFGSRESYEAFNEFMEARRTVRELERALIRVDSRERAESIAGHRSGLLVRADSGIPESSRLHISSIVRGELDSLGVAAPAYPVAVVVMIDPTQLTPHYLRAIVLPGTEGDPCTVVIRMSGRQPRFRQMVTTDRLLGTCGFYAVHGAPGAGMRRWLDETGLAAAAFLQRPASHGDGRVRDPTEANASGRAADMAACRARRLDGCERLFTDPADPRYLEGSSQSQGDSIAGDVLVTTPTALGAQRTGVTAGLLSSMAHDMGRERFGAVWRSQSSPVEAFEAAEGRPLAAWVYDRVRTTIVDYHAGPGLNGVQWASLLLVLAIATGVGLRFSEGRLS